MKVKYPIEPISKVKNLKHVTYGCKLVMVDGTEFWFTLTEMQVISDMWKSFKKQGGFKTLKR